MSLLLPHLNQHATAATSTSSSATTALIQRAKTLQEENDELYELLKVGETGRLKEDVRALRRVVQKMEGALRGVLQISPREGLLNSLLGRRITSSYCVPIVRSYIKVLRASPNPCL